MRRYRGKGAKRLQGNKQESPKDDEESQGELESYSVRGDRNLPEQKNKIHESIPADGGSNFRKQGRSTPIKDKSRKCCANEQHI